MQRFVQTDLTAHGPDRESVLETKLCIPWGLASAAPTCLRDVKKDHFPDTLPVMYFVIF